MELKVKNKTICRSPLEHHEINGYTVNGINGYTIAPKGRSTIKHGCQGLKTTLLRTGDFFFRAILQVKKIVDFREGGSYEFL